MTRDELLQVSMPILFNSEMVRAILDGRKTVTRRLIKPPPKCCIQQIEEAVWLESKPCANGVRRIRSPYCPGDTLYVRETWQEKPEEIGGGYFYKADAEAVPLYRWRPSIHMPKEAARIFLRVKEVRAEQLQQISAKDVAKEGVNRRELHPNGCRCTWEQDNCQNEPCANREAYELLCWATPFAALWDSTIHKADLNQYGWNANPWVWVIEFERMMPDA